MKIGLTSTTFRQIKSLEKIVNIAVQAGVDCIEWGGDIHVTDVESAQRAKQLCLDAGIEISSYGSYYRVGSGKTDEWKRICEIVHTMGAKIIRVWLGEKGSEETDNIYYKKILNDLIEICKIADEYGLTVSPECHTYTFNDNTEKFIKISKEFKKNTNLSNFKTYFQSKYKTKNIAYDFDRIEKTLNEIEIVHISYSERMREQAFSKKNRKYVPQLLKKLKETGYDKIILIEYTYFASPAFFFKDVSKLKKDWGN